MIRYVEKRLKEKVTKEDEKMTTKNMVNEAQAKENMKCYIKLKSKGR